MTLEERKMVNTEVKSQQIVLNDRRKMKLTGVSEVESFSETAVCADTCAGRISVKGEGLKINKLDTDDGEIVIDGKINAVEYTEKKEKGKFFESIFK